MSADPKCDSWPPGVRVYDPARRLPPGAPSLFPAQIQGTLLVPDRGVPLHVESVRRLAQQAGSGRALSFVPEIPVSSDLGLVRYPALLYWIPAASEPADPFWSRWLRRRPRDQAPWPPPEPAGTEPIRETSLEEQVVYFAEHFTTICPVPIQVSPVVSNTCNLKCVMCPYHSPAIRPTHRTPFFQDRTRMSWDLMDRLATECGEMRAPVKMGNVEEPLIHPEIIRFVHACRARGVPGVHITSNGQALTEGLSRQLLEAGLTSLYVSVDASRPETYLRIRGASLERIEANVRSFLRVRKEMGASCSMMLSFVRNKGVGEDEAAEFREKWLGEGANGVIFYNLAEYQDGDARFERVHQVARSRMDAVGGRWPCLNPFQEIYALPDGRIYYCCETVSKLAFESLESMGAYPAQSLRAIWQGPAFTALRRDLIRNEIQAWPACRTCGIWMAHVTETVTENGRTVTRNMITEIVRP